MSFRDSTTSGVTLVKPAIQSPDYVAGTTGWTINADGTAEFNNVTVRGELEVDGDGSSSIRVFTIAGQPYITLDPGVAVHDPARLYVTATGPTLYIEGPNQAATSRPTLSMSATDGIIMYDVENPVVIQGSPVSISGDVNLSTDVTINDVSIGRGLALNGFAASSTSSSAVSSETTVATLTDVEIREGRAYRLEYGSKVETSNANGQARFRARLTNATGTLWADYGTTVGTTAGLDMNSHGTTFLRRLDGTSTSNATIVLTLENTSGGGATATHVAIVGGIRFFSITDVGDADDYPSARSV